MSVCVVIQNRGVTSTGSDVTPGAINWSNIAQTGVGTAVFATTNTQTVTAIDTPVTLRATYTEFGDGAILSWVKNGVVQSPTEPADITVNLNDTLAIRMSLVAGLGAAAENGVVTVINKSDSDAAIDTFTYELERV